MSPSRRDSVTCCHSLLQKKWLTLVSKSFPSLPPRTTERPHDFCQNRSAPSAYARQTNPGRSTTAQRRWKSSRSSLTAALATRSRQERLRGFGCANLTPVCLPCKVATGVLLNKQFHARTSPLRSCPAAWLMVINKTNTEALF